MLWQPRQSITWEKECAMGWRNLQCPVTLSAGHYLWCIYRGMVYCGYQLARDHLSRKLVYVWCAIAVSCKHSLRFFSSLSIFPLCRNYKINYATCVFKKDSQLRVLRRSKFLKFNEVCKKRLAIFILQISYIFLKNMFND